MNRRKMQRDQILDEIAEAVFYKLLEEGAIDAEGNYVNEDIRSKIRNIGAGLAMGAATLFGAGKAGAQDVAPAPEVHQSYDKQQSKGAVASMPQVKTPEQIKTDSLKRVNDALQNFVRGTGGKDYSMLFAQRFFEGFTPDSLESLFKPGFEITGTFVVTLPSTANQGKVMITNQSGENLQVVVQYNLRTGKTLVTLAGTSVPIFWDRDPGDPATLEELEKSNAPLHQTIVDEIQRPLRDHALAQIIVKILPEASSNWNPRRIDYKFIEEYRSTGGGDNPGRVAFDMGWKKLVELGGKTPGLWLFALKNNPQYNPFKLAEWLPGKL